jgi:fructan beta-fructosidase
MFIAVLFVTGYLYQGCTSTGNANNSNFTLRNQYRPEFHFTPDSMWMNDPNGMVYFDGEYHLFYQFYPDSTVWGPMHWGHAVSNDLVHWEHLPIALYPDSLGYIFSGSAVADINNTSGFGSKDQLALVAIFTYHDIKGERAGSNDFQTQGIAYSLDKGRTWTKYEKNPVLKNPGQRDFRDPKVSWNNETGKWIMTLASGDHVCFYSSPDLKNWTLESEFGKGIGAHGGVWECPDLFELPVEGNSAEKKWVLLVSINPGGPNGGSATQYFVGKFDGHQFINESAKIKWTDYGKDNYAGVTYSNIPQTDGRRILIGWMSNWQYAQVVPTSPWRSAMTFARSLKLTKEADGYSLNSLPVDEIQLLREQKTDVSKAIITAEKPLDLAIPSQPYPLEVLTAFKVPAANPATTFGIELYNDNGEKVIVGFDRQQSKFYIDRTKSGITDFSNDFAGVHYSGTIPPETDIDFHLLIDAASVELFAMKGKVVMTEIYFPRKNLDKIRITTTNGNIELEDGTVYKLTANKY